MHLSVTALASSLYDNWIYAIRSGDDLVFVDPIDSEQCIQYARTSGAKNFKIFVTHGHPDHIEGNPAVVDALDCPVIASRHPDIFNTPCDEQVGDGDTLKIGDTTWQVIHAPGHTTGHLVLYHPGHLISGDVFFVGGIGNCRFGGDPDELFDTVTKRLAHIPGDTVFYPGHDYSLRNYEFCTMVEPTNTLAAHSAREAEAFYGGKPRRAPWLQTLGDERRLNPFHRTHEPALQRHLQSVLAEDWPQGESDPSRAAFKALRARRDRF